ncbi:UNVERIFIED_CONTAM: hypothetical protein Sangu_2728100 [Sesamum angustifolium]|uniref:Reverse transcriptase domain-containing protein n=1 Tax=Sesamum angustifolium TaxID=2727405 RepID=A0AAW2IXG0_9LAMI
MVNYNDLRRIDLEFLRHELKHTISTAEASLLVTPVTLSEVKEAFFDIDVESAPGPDGYTSAFFRNAWPVIGQAMFQAVGEFFRTGKMLKQINTTLISLIPKVSLPRYVSDYRPIACCNVLYKSITKIIVKRLQQVLPLMIDYSQNAFVPGRSITDNILLAQELMAGYNHKRLPPRCMIKVDIQKAYDSVEWDFLLEVLKLFNFPHQFIVLINQCVSTASFSVSLNGSIHGFFKGGRGLRQGDPMSPYLFVLVMEIWNLLLRFRIKEAADFQYHWKCKDIGLINLCFADDVLLFCKAHLPSIMVITDTLNEFAALSGLKVNPAKSQIIFLRAVQQERQQILDYLGFQEGSLPVKYLGIPLTSSRLTIADCRPLIDKVDARLAGWNNQILSYAGRLQLIKSVLTTLHTYWASAFILPKGVLKTLEKKMRQFLWQGSAGSGNAKAHGVGRMLKLRPLLQRGVIYKIGDGSSFSLWQDAWHERGPLCLIFPRGPEVTGLPLSSSLSSVIQSNQWCWPASTDADFIGITAQLPPLHPSAADYISWRSSTGKFTFLAAVSLIQPTTPRVSWSVLLQGNFKIRHGFILWMAILEKLSTMDKPGSEG